MDETMKRIVAPLRGGMLIDWIKNTHVQRTEHNFMASENELELLARHWAEEIAHIDGYFAEGYSGSYEIRMQPYAYYRLDAIAEVLGKEPVQKIFDEEIAKVFGMSSSSTSTSVEPAAKSQSEPTMDPQHRPFSWCGAMREEMNGHRFLIDETKDKKPQLCHVCGADGARLYAVEWCATCKNRGDQMAWLCPFCAELFVAAAKWDGMRRFRFEHFDEKFRDLWQAIDLLNDIGNSQPPQSGHSNP